MTEKRSKKDNLDTGHMLGMCATIRILASKVATLAEPQNPDQWFTALGEHAFGYVDRTTNPDFKGETEKEIKEAAYGTLRMIFDPNGLKF
jgi:hypothetical protein